MPDGADLALPAADYLAACGAAAAAMERAGSTGSPGLKILRHDLPGCGATLLCVLPPAGCYWGLPCRGTDRNLEWADACSLEPAFVEALRKLAGAGQGGLSHLPTAFAGGLRIVGPERDMEIGADAADVPGTRLLPWLVPTQGVSIALARLERHLRQLGSFAALAARPLPAGEQALPCDFWLSPRLLRLFAPDHGRGVLVAGTSADAAAALEDALRHLDEPALRAELSPRLLAEEIIRLRYPIADPRVSAAGRRVGVAARLFASNAAGPGEIERVALLRSQLLRRLGWPTGLDLLRRAGEPAMHRAMLGGRAPWAPLEDEVQASLQAARIRYPVMFETQDP